jgi:hypothetical protein
MAAVVQALEDLACGQKDLAAEGNSPDPHIDVVIAIEDYAP